MGDYDPFAERKLEHPTSDNDTLMHLLKSALGSGILGMPIAFMYSGIILGVFTTIITAFICAHCSYIMVKSAHILYYKTRTSAMTIAEVAEVSFLIGPECSRCVAPIVKYFTGIGIFLTYFGTCSCYVVIMASNFQQILELYGHVVSLRLMIVYLLVPCILICWIPNLKFLAPVSAIANLCMLLGLGVTCYYLVQGLPSITDREYYQLATLPQFFTLTIFAMGSIGVIMPLENNMETPTHFLGVCGVLSQGMSFVATVYMILGFVGYLRYGPETAESITLNLPVDEAAAQFVKLAINLALYGTFALQFFVVLEIAWNTVKETLSSTFANYVLRTIIVVAAVGLALLVPTIAPFMGLIGAFCFSTLGIILPALVEIVTYADIGYGPCKCMIFKDIFLTIFGIFVLIFGSISAVKDILALYE